MDVTALKNRIHRLEQKILETMQNFEAETQVKVEGVIYQPDKQKPLKIKITF